MIAQDNYSKLGDVNSRQVTYQEDDNPKLRNENIQEHKELHEQIQAYFLSVIGDFGPDSSSKNWIV